MSSTLFNFHAPPGMPSLTFPEPVAIAIPRSPQPLPNVPLVLASPTPAGRTTQGREKRADGG
jgi:hypothetical protein